MASASMPTPVTAQPISTARAPATSAMFWGRLKMPAPTMELNTSAVRDQSPILLSFMGAP